MNPSIEIDGAPENLDAAPARPAARAARRRQGQRKVKGSLTSHDQAIEALPTAEASKRTSALKPNRVTRRKIASLMRRRKIQLVALELLKPDPNNPRRHSRAQIRKLARCIEIFGFNTILVVDKDFYIVVGHGRYEALKLMGEKQVWVIIVDDLAPEQIKAYAIADNKLSDLSKWDEEALARRLKELSEVELSFEIEAIGFERPEIAFRTQALDANDDGLDRADEYTPASGPPVTQAGDRWIAGDHIVAQGDARDPELLATLLGGEEFDALFADAPYNVKIFGHVSGLGKVKHREFGMAVSEMTKAEFTAFLAQFLANARDRARQGAIFYVCMDWRHVVELSAAASAAGLELLNICVWVKPNGGMGSFYRSRHEFVFVLRTPGGPHINNVQLGRFGRNRSNVWDYAGANGFPRRGRQRALDVHPTPKPVRMVADAILDCTHKGDLILDPFLGGGTTLLACERVGRRCRAIELDPLYVDTAIERWQRMTGRAAIHTSGKSFDQMRAERRQSGGAS